MNHPLESALQSLQTLTVFYKLRTDPVVSRFERMLAVEDLASLLPAYADFASALFAHTTCWSDYLLRAVSELETFYLQKCARHEPIEPELDRCLDEELRILEQLSRIAPATVQSSVRYGGYLPRWSVASHDFVRSYHERIDNLSRYGYGVFAKHRAFFWKDGEPVPVEHPDPQRLSDLVGYEYQRSLIEKNTLALIEGRPAANVLLYGDAGTGKSSTVKALVNEYADRGLRLIELKKHQLHDIPQVLSRIAYNPLRFILFIDDLSFNGSDDNFTALKAVLEGSVAARPDNLVVYATSNRRHLVKETFSDRAGDEIHRNDTIQELNSLSDRFGLSVSFIRPDKQVYLDIVDKLAPQYGITLPQDELHIRAEAHAIARGGRSPRVAVQFIRSLAASLNQ